MTIFDGVTVSYNLDYRSNTDDAWYTCGVLLQDGKKLRVKFMDFAQSYEDEVYSINDFSTHHEIEEFLLRFRPVSEPIEDYECSRVIEGMMVSATYTNDGLVRFFDAIVDDVHYKGHTPEKCLCTYLLFWQHGPDEGNITSASIDEISFVNSGSVDPKVAEFAMLVREKLKRVSSQSSLISNPPFLSRKTSSNQTLNKLQESSGAGDGCCSRFPEGRGRFKTQLIDHDRDMGGIKETGSHHYIILENLEKSLSPVLMAEFIHEQTSLTAQTYVFPSLSAENFARGAIVSNNRSILKRIYDFISNPNHFIASFSGRPWVIAEDTIRTGTFNINLQSLQPKSEDRNTRSELMVVLLGTEEYTRAKQLKDLYMEFRNHLNGLVEKLDMDEKNTNSFLQTVNMQVL